MRIAIRSDGALICDVSKEIIEVIEVISTHDARKPQNCWIWSQATMKSRILTVTFVVFLIVFLSVMYWTRLLGGPSFKWATDETQILRFVAGGDYRKLVSIYGMPHDIERTESDDRGLRPIRMVYDTAALDSAKEVTLEWRWFTVWDGAVKLNADFNSGKMVGLQYKIKGYSGVDDDIPFVWHSPDR